MDEMFQTVNSSDFWVGVLLGQVILWGGLFWLIASTSPTRLENTSKNQTEVDSRTNSF